eukprot:365597-Chlamydomonas_euryale.AAC.2
MRWLSVRIDRLIFSGAFQPSTGEYSRTAVIETSASSRSSRMEMSGTCHGAERMEWVGGVGGGMCGG